MTKLELDLKQKTFLIDLLKEEIENGYWSDRMIESIESLLKQLGYYKNK